MDIVSDDAGAQNWASLGLVDLAQNSPGKKFGSPQADLTISTLSLFPAYTASPQLWLRWASHSLARLPS